MADQPTAAVQGLPFKAYTIVSRAVEEGIAYGIRRVFKYNQEPLSEDLMLREADRLVDAVMMELCEIVDFDEGWQLRLTAVDEPSHANQEET